MEELLESPRIKKHETYKHSGLDWIGEIPEHWDVISFRYCIELLTDFTSNGSFASLAANVNYLNNGYSRLIRLTDLRVNMTNQGIYVDEKAHKFLSNSELFGGELLIANVGAYAGLAQIMPKVNYKSTLGPNMFLLRINQDVKYYYYLINSSHYKSNIENTAMAAAQPKLNKENIRSIRVLRPPIDEQEKIKEFLNTNIKKIDLVINRKESQIELLKERKQILINKVLTRGVNPDVILKNSGVDWIDKIPDHWDVRRLKYVFKILKRIVGELGHDILSITQNGIKVKDTESGEGQLSMDYSKYQMVSKGEFAMNHMDLLTGYVDVSNFNGVMSPDYRVFDLIDSNLNKDYFLLLLQLCYKNKAFYANGQGVSMLGRWRFPTENFNNFLFPIPPVEEQRAIAEYINYFNNKIETAISCKQKEIEKIREYKAALINSAVTGKIKVS